MMCSHHSSSIKLLSGRRAGDNHSMKIYLAHGTQFDFKEKLYIPIRNSDLNRLHEFLLPHEDGIEINSKELIQNSDLILIDVSVPSVGAGIEAGWADAFGKRIICVHEVGTTPPQALTHLTNTFISYADATELIEKLRSVIDQA
jgi:hypothetical protein